MFGGTLEAQALTTPSNTQSFTFTKAGDFPHYYILHQNVVGITSVSENLRFPFILLIIFPYFIVLIGNSIHRKIF
jgi:hypothetical protein